MAWLVGVPGTSLFTQLIFDDETISAIQLAFGDKAVVITDVSTYVVSQDGMYSRIGGGLPGRVSTASNGAQVVAVNGAAGLVITETTETVISDPDFSPANTVAFQGGYFVFDRKGSGQIFASGIYDGAAFDALDFATAESNPDQTVAVAAVRREIWAFGQRTVEVFSLAASTAFPFAPLPGVSISFGCVAPHSAIPVDQSMCWLSPDGIVYQSQGYQPLRISSHEIEEELKTIRSEWPEAFAWTYIEDGHQFYMLTVGGQTFGYDFATREWHKRKSAGREGHIANACATVLGRILIGDDRGRLLEMSRDFTSDTGQAVIVEIGSLPIGEGTDWFTVNSFEIDAVVGVGGVAQLAYSDDDGATWSSWLDADAGAVGRHMKRLQWRRLGHHLDLRIRLRMAGDHKKRFSTTGDIR